MPRPKGSKNKPKDTIVLGPEDSKLFIESLANPLPATETLVEAFKNEEKMTKPAELNDTAFSIIKNPNGTLSCIKIPYDLKTGTFGTPEVIETGDRHDAFFRMKVVTAELWG